MSNIFAPYARYFGGLIPLSIDTSEQYANQHLWVEDMAYVQAIEEGVVHHHGAGLPFDSAGRLVISSGAISYVDQGVPFTAEGYVATQDGDVVSQEQGIGFTASGHIATFTIGGPATAPRWLPIPNKWDYLEELGPPADYDVSPYAHDSGDPITLYAINPPVAGLSIHATSGVISVVDEQRAPEVLSVIVEATNGLGTTASDPFEWELRIYPSDVPIETNPDWYFSFTPTATPTLPHPTRSWLYYTPQNNSIGFLDATDPMENPAPQAARRGLLYTLNTYADVEVSATINYDGTLGLTSHGLVARFVDSNNYISVRARSSTYQFHERVEEIPTNVNIAQVAVPGDKVTLRLVGTVGTMLVNDIEIYSGPLISLQATGRVGILNVTQGDPLYGRFIFDFTAEAYVP